MSPFPQLLSDEEFAHVLEQRGQAERHRILAVNRVEDWF